MEDAGKHKKRAHLKVKSPSHKKYNMIGGLTPLQQFVTKQKIDDQEQQSGDL